MKPRSKHSIPQSLARAIGSLPLPPRIGGPPSAQPGKTSRPAAGRPFFSRPHPVVLPHPERFNPGRVAGGVPERRLMPVSVAGRLGKVPAGIAGRLGVFNPPKPPR
jgi:hypothetical protein